MFKKIIDNMYTLEYKHDIVQSAKHLLYYKHKFNKLNKEKAVIFCNKLLEYMVYELNLLNTIEYSKTLKFLKYDNIPKKYNNHLDDALNSFYFYVDIFCYD